MYLKIYQENAIEELLEKAKKLLAYSDERKLVFKSPTGSGKTIMVAEFLKQLVENYEVRQPLSFIWTAPRPVLTNQSKEKLENYFEKSRTLQCSFFEDLNDRQIGENEVLFFNWEKVRRENLIYIRDNEQDFNLSRVIKNTKEAGREIVLVIDESHYHAQAETSQNLIRDIEPDLTIEVSATPVLRGDKNVDVDIEDVKAEGMIKKAVILNEKFINLLKKGKIESELSKGSEELVIDASLKKRRELLRAFQKEKLNINPLVLIQLPDRIGQLEDTMKSRVIGNLKDKHNISTENGKLAIWLSGEHINKENVEKNESEVEVLIFKQAIALGWDCPRAQILSLFREWHSPIFSIQTVGRIMRMPQPDKGHYGNDILNYGYVYTNLSDIEIKEDIAHNYITVHASTRKAGYKPINLLSCYSKRHREKTRLSPLFIEIFLKEAKRYKLKEKVDKEAKRLDIKVFNDWKAENIDTLAGKMISGDKAITVSDFDLQRLFDYFVRQNLTPFYPEDRSVGRVKESIYKFFESEFKMKRGEEEDEAIQVTLSGKNIQYFVNVIDKTKEEYQKEIVKREPELIFNKDWNIPESIRYNENYIQEEHKKSIMQPFFTDNRWKTERTFIEFLEKSKNIVWWFKNGDRDRIFFAAPYDNGEQKPFYVDFIVKLKDGRIGLFDTKAGITQQVAGAKADGLYKYIRSENKKGKKLFGGIVINTDRNYRGRWIYFDKLSKQLADNNIDKWRTLEL